MPNPIRLIPRPWGPRPANTFSKETKALSMEVAQRLIKEQPGGYVVMGTAEGDEAPGGMVVAAIRFKTIAAAQAFNEFARQVAKVESGQ